MFHSLTTYSEMQLKMTTVVDLPPKTRPQFQAEVDKSSFSFLADNY